MVFHTGSLGGTRPGAPKFDQNGISKVEAAYFMGLIGADASCGAFFAPLK
jgi:hypothetical protein